MQAQSTHQASEAALFVGFIPLELVDADTRNVITTKLTVGAAGLTTIDIAQGFPATEGPRNLANGLLHSKLSQCCYACARPRAAHKRYVPPAHENVASRRSQHPRECSRQARSRHEPFTCQSPHVALAGCSIMNSD